ncbi:hypothetical protein PN476_15500 [Dolichospermum circinale CS-537/05]|nr:hypothetical protein [Dolichospermum circinale CS-537/05]
MTITSCKSLNPGHPDMACATLRYQTKNHQPLRQMRLFSDHE